MTGLLRVYAASGALTLFICFHLKPEYGIGLYVLSLFKLTGVILYFVLNSIRNFKNEQIGFKPLYATLFVDAFFNLFIFFAHLQRPVAAWIFIIIQTIICWYFIFIDYSEVAKE